MIRDLEVRPNKHNWASLVMDTLFTLGLNYVWFEQNVGHTEYFLEELKLRLRDSFIQNWEARLKESSRGRFYVHFMSFDFKQYLNILNVKKFRVALTRFRTSSNRLEVETGRWQKPNPIPYNERLCNSCRVLGDEFHFIFECKLLEYLLNLYITPQWLNLCAQKMKKM